MSRLIYVKVYEQFPELRAYSVFCSVFTIGIEIQRPFWLNFCFILKSILLLRSGGNYCEGARCEWEHDPVQDKDCNCIEEAHVNLLWAERPGRPGIYGYCGKTQAYFQRMFLKGYKVTVKVNIVDKIVKSRLYFKFWHLSQFTRASGSHLTGSASPKQTLPQALV